MSRRASSPVAEHEHATPPTRFWPPGGQHDTAYVARQPNGQIVGYLLGFVAPTGDGYTHFVAVRDDARGRGLERGAKAPKAVTDRQNEESIAFHRKLASR